MKPHTLALALVACLCLLPPIASAGVRETAAFCAATGNQWRPTCVGILDAQAQEDLAACVQQAQWQQGAFLMTFTSQPASELRDGCSIQAM